jgi:hypothetical protein
MQLCNDNSFGPVVIPGCRGGFDFTLLFEQSYLSIVPSAVLTIAFPLRLQYLLRHDIKLKAPKTAILCARLASRSPTYTLQASKSKEENYMGEKLTIAINTSSYLQHLLGYNWHC